ncbi:LytTR family DNA-binding domain-containing protein [Thalassotalea ganghwensis]
MNPSIKQFIFNLLLCTAIGMFLGYLSPFGMHALPRSITILYWVLICIMGYLIYSSCINAGEHFLSKKVNHLWIRIAISSTVASALMSLAIPFLDWAIFDSTINPRYQFVTIFPKAIIIGGVVTLIMLFKESLIKQRIALRETQSKLSAQQQATNQIHDKNFQQFIEQLPIEKRGKLLCLEMSDHYLKVHTDKGHHLLLMRFKDALKQLEHFPGIQTHRSWWVAKDAVACTQKDRRKLVVVLENDLQVPVSKTYQDDVKQELLGKSFSKE